MEGPNNHPPLFLGKWVAPTPIRPLHPHSMWRHNGAVEGQLSKVGWKYTFWDFIRASPWHLWQYEVKSKDFFRSHGFHHQLENTSVPFCLHLFTREAIKHFLISSDFFIKQKHKVQENSDKRILQKRRNARLILV